MQTVYFSAVFLESLLKYKDVNWILATCPFRMPFQPRLEKLIILLTFSSKLMCSFDSLMKGTWTKVLTILLIDQNVDHFDDLWFIICNSGISLTSSLQILLKPAEFLLLPSVWQKFI